MDSSQRNPLTTLLFVISIFFHPAFSESLHATPEPLKEKSIEQLLGLKERLLQTENLVSNGSYNELQSFVKQRVPYRLDFRQEKWIAGFSKPLPSTGIFYLFPTHGVSWRTGAPYTMSITLTRKHFIRTSQFQNEETVQELKDNPITAQISEIFLDVFHSNFESLSKKFTIYFEHHDKGWSLGLTPLDREMNSFLSLILLTGEDLLSDLYLQEGKDKTIISFSKRADSKTKIRDTERTWFEKDQ